jgi:hypothetical protein
MDLYRDKNDWWVGYYRGEQFNYVCLLPTLVIRWPRKIRLVILDGGRAVGRTTGVRRTQRPDVRRIVLRPVNIDQPSSRVTQALFRQRPTRKPHDNDPRDID